MQLSLTELRKRPGRIETLVNKVRNKTPFDLVNGDTKVFDRIQFTESGRVIEIIPSKDPRQIQLALEFLRRKASSSKFIILANDKDKYPLTDIMKTADFGGAGGKSSKGAGVNARADVYESIYAAALYARFLNQTDMIVEQDIIKVLDRLRDNKTKQLLITKTQNKSRKIADLVTLKVTGSLSSMRTLTDKSMQFALADIIQGSLKYANSANAIKWGKLLFENNRRNNIVISATGAGEQKGTHIVVVLRIDGKLINVQTPLKLDDIKNNGRVIGGAFEEINTMSKSVFGIGIEKYATQFYKTREMRGVSASTIYAYNMIAYEYNKSVSNNRMKTYTKMSDSIDDALAKKKSYIAFSPMTRTETQLFKFGNFGKLFTDNTKAVLRLERNLPVINIIDSKNLTLFKIQAKQEIKINAAYMTHYVTKGPALIQLGKYIST